MKICSVEECKNKSCKKGYCIKHYTQMYRFGKILPITRSDPNEITIKENHAEIVLRDIKNKEVGKCLINLEDVEKIKNYKWHVDKDGYAVTSLNGSKRMTRFLLNITDPKTFVDHINHNILDNRKENLRSCTGTENNGNRKINKRGSSKYKGVQWCKQKGKWISGVIFNGKKYYLGTFIVEEEAALAYNEKAKELFGEFTCLNVIKPKLKLRRI